MKKCPLEASNCHIRSNFGVKLGRDSLFQLRWNVVVALLNIPKMKMSRFDLETTGRSGNHFSYQLRNCKGLGDGKCIPPIHSLVKAYQGSCLLGDFRWSQDRIKDRRRKACNPATQVSTWWGWGIFGVSLKCIGLGARAWWHQDQLGHKEIIDSERNIMMQILGSMCSFWNSFFILNSLNKNLNFRMGSLRI